MPRARLSAVLITLNEAPQIASLVDALRWTDEIVVYDGGSHDGTPELARRLGCRTFVHPFDTFAAQRNRALRAAEGDWVLSLDADERPTPALADEIRQRLSDPDAAAYRIRIRSRIFGRRMRFSGTQDDRPVRLFRRDAARWIGHVHEVLQVRGPVRTLRAALEHTTLPDLNTFLRKMHCYTTLQAAQRVAAQQPPRWAELWLRPLAEVARRLVWKLGLLDGPQGWAFCALSGLSHWILAQKHRQLWRTRHLAAAAPTTCAAGNAADGAASAAPQAAIPPAAELRPA
jgi:glycosyltransferase involved in cell wall biosynthesis